MTSDLPTNTTQKTLRKTNWDYFAFTSAINRALHTRHAE